MGDGAIRAALVERLAARAGAGPAMILHELAVGSGTIVRRPMAARWYRYRGLTYYISPNNLYAQAASARADVALLTPDALDLFEIKADCDSLVRLQSQTRAYDDTGSSNTVVVGESHLSHAFDAVPPGWGIVAAGGDPVVLRDVRPCAPNPSRNVRGLTNPLYRRELLPLILAHRARRGSREDFVEFFGSHGRCNLELHERWLRVQLAGRNWSPARKHGATVVGDVEAWHVRERADLLARVLSENAGRQLTLFAS